MKRLSSIVFLIILLFLNPSDTQFCQNTEFTSSSRVSCPQGFTYAYTLARVTDNGQQQSYSYSNKCCNSTAERALIQAKRDAQGCQTSECLVTDLEQANPCATLDIVIVDDVFIQYEKALLDDCLDERGQRGFAAVCCPQNSNHGVLISAYGAEYNEFPHQARVFVPSIHPSIECGGTVYNKDYVITAAHCFTDRFTGAIIDPIATNLSVVLGTNLGEIESRTNVFSVEEILVHENYSLRASHPERTIEREVTIHGQSPRIYNDIALLKLKNSIDFNLDPNIKALELSAANFAPLDYADQIIILGWGNTDTLTSSQHLQKANVLIRNKDRCFAPLNHRNGRGEYFQYAEFREQLLCVGGYVDGKFSPMAGKGDSGGPSICRNQIGNAVLCGTSSFGRDDEQCTLNKNSCKPSVYTFIGYFRDWIVQKAGPQDPSTLYRAHLYGESVPEGMYASHVHITSADGKSCGGTLISFDTVLTAGNCVLTDSKEVRNDIRITYGVRDLNISSAESNVYKLRNGGVHFLSTFARWAGLDSINPDGERMLDSPYRDNVALLKLDRNVSTTFDNLVKLPKAGLPLPEPAIEVAFPLNISRSGKLLQRQFNLLSVTDCQKRVDRFGTLGVETRFNKTQALCGVEKYSGGSLCDRELGGGLFCEVEGEEVLCGVQTFRLCDLSLPNTFLNVWTYMPFIQQYL